MGVTKEVKSAMESAINQAKAEILTKLDKVCLELEERLVKVVGELEERVVMLEGDNVKLRSRINALERYERGDSLEFHNVPVTESEDTEKLIVKIGDVMGVKLTANDISSAYRLPVKKDKPNSGLPRIYVKFTRRKLRRLLYAVRSKKPVTHTNLGHQTRGKIYIHEHLSKEQSDLYYQAKDKVKSESFKYLWTQDNRIFVRYSDSSKRIAIDCPSDLDKITTLSGLKLRSGSTTVPR